MMWLHRSMMYQNEHEQHDIHDQEETQEVNVPRQSGRVRKPPDRFQAGNPAVFRQMKQHRITDVVTFLQQMESFPFKTVCYFELEL